MFTLFAGTDEAFNVIPEVFQIILFENDEYLPHLRTLLLFNILMGELFEADFTDGASVTAFNRESFPVTRNPFRVNGITVTGADNDVSNGVVHIINDILTPSWVSRSLLNRIEQEADLTITNEFLIFSGIAPFLMQPGDNLTLLAPTNDAWLALGQDTLVFLSDPDNLEFLQQALLYHILQGVFTSTDQDFPSRINTFQGNVVAVVSVNPLQFNQAQVVAADILANSGVLQKINGVLDFTSPPE
jgi:transforming growth factor-beta-induced protein